MSRLLALLLLASPAFAQNIVGDPLDHPSPNCYENNCVCPKNYSIRTGGMSKAIGGVGANCEYDGLRSGGEPDTKNSRVNKGAWTSTVDPIGNNVSGTTESGAIVK